ncbi:MAG TPA: phosphatase PAP2 family protein [Acidimicrobiales bacterium]|nr:phosphatase PAP2 family protein [Acidimicrobiales bacterium]
MPQDRTARRELGGLTEPVDPSSLSFGDMVQMLDDRVDTWFEPLRGRPVPDTVARIVSGLGDHGLLWAASTAWRARHPGTRRNRAVRALAVAGAESSVVNAVLKAVIGRPRPDGADLRLGDNIVPLREPTSSSFPSGHTLAAFCAATVLSEQGDLGGNALLFGCAGLIGASRIHLQAHHGSDVLGGMAIGVVLGLVGRRLV